MAEIELQCVVDENIVAVSFLPHEAPRVYDILDKDQVNGHNKFDVEMRVL